ncbi:hypothetical protein AYI68_g397 [Smittium mucronatum]|uniref:Uncharacterized protein n=1 Tax=Smittium mucronatum TaxID=133383 RepID=A0A1R0H8F8_9FUNG|nr:hypothetical protein AYI68_g397 [Smittium mucronatum]
MSTEVTNNFIGTPKFAILFSHIKAITVLPSISATVASTENFTFFWGRGPVISISQIWNGPSACKPFFINYSSSEGGAYLDKISPFFKYISSIDTVNLLASFCCSGITALFRGNLHNFFFNFRWEWNASDTIKNNKNKVQKAFFTAYGFLNRDDVLLALKIKFINTVLSPIGCYGGEKFGMSEARCKPIQSAIDRAMRLVEKVGKNEPLERLREELGINSVFIRTSTARERAYYKWPASNAWTSDLIKHPITAKKSTWVTGCARWIKKYCHNSEKEQTVISLVNRKAKNNCTKINQWAIQSNIRDKGSWIILQAMHPVIDYTGRYK